MFTVVIPQSPLPALRQVQPEVNTGTQDPAGQASDTVGNVGEQGIGQSPRVHHSSPDIGINRAFKVMKKRLKSNGFKGEVKPPPEGEPMFLFFGAQGRTKPVNILFDTGCSHAVFREGIPGKELRGMITHKGPFYMKGVGGIVTTANNQWLCALDTPGGKQFVSGVTVETVTIEFPVIELDQAVKEMKADASQDLFL